MARIDVPTLQCDRCRKLTQDNKTMAVWQKIAHHTMSTGEEWDLCTVCWTDFRNFIYSGVQ